MDTSSNGQNGPLTQNLPQPATPPVGASPAPPAEKITLQDLYGPSGLANENPNTAPVQQPVQEQPVQQAPPASTEETLKDLPLRKKQIDPPPLQPKNTDSTPPKGGIKTISLVRILFGFIAIAVLLVVIMFVVTFLSSALHPVASGKVTLTYWGLWEDSNTIQVAISAFERQHPTIAITYEKEDPKDYSQRLLTRIQEGNGPDIFTYHSSWLPMVQSVLVPLPTSVISKDDLQNNFYPVVSRDLVKNGALYGIPLEVDTLSLFVNNTLFQKAKAQVPTTWDSFTPTARALTQKDGNGKIQVAGAALGTYDNITHAPDILTALYAQNGVDISTMSPKSNAADALSFYTTFALGDSKVWDVTLDPSLLAFSKGNLAMYFGYSWDIFTIKAANPNLDFSIYPIPHLPGRNTTAASYWVEGISVKSTHQKEALLFMNFLAEKNTESLLYAEEAKTRLFGEPYARSDLGSTLKDNALIFPFVNQATNATSSFFAGETQDTGLNGQMNGYLGNAIRSVLNDVSPDTAMDTLIQGVKQVQNQYATQ